VTLKSSHLNSLNSSYSTTLSKITSRELKLDSDTLRVARRSLLPPLFPSSASKPHYELEKNAILPAVAVGMSMSMTKTLVVEFLS
jgi:hypothetical protein